MVEEKKRENSVVNHYLTEVWGTNIYYLYKTLYINKLETNKGENIYVNCVTLKFKPNTLSC